MSLKAEIEALIATWREEARFSREHANFNDANNPIEHTDMARLVEHLADELSALIAASREPQAEASETKSPEWGLANVYTIARRRLRALSESNPEREWWQHVVRISEESGVRQPGVLRHSVPTEITDGAGKPLPPVEPKEK